jgi:hypothetical protein
LLEFFLWSDATQGLDAGEGGPSDIAAGMGWAFEVAGGRLSGEFEIDGFALDGPAAADTPGGGADFLDSVLLDEVARGDAQHVLADEFLEAFERLLIDDGDFGEQV